MYEPTQYDKRQAAEFQRRLAKVVCKGMIG